MKRRLSKAFLGVFLITLTVPLGACGKRAVPPTTTSEDTEIQDITQYAKELIAQMTLEEKVGQMMHRAKSIPRLGLKDYVWWNEALHGVARAGLATVFPQAIGLAATFDEELIYRVADAISTEARGKYNAAQAKGDHGIYKGLTFWSPNINIFRDPRWGRGQETYGEDPYLTSQIGIAFVEGMHGDDPDQLKTAACAKHYAVHSGPEESRHSFDAVVSQRELYETYLPAFEALVKEAKVEAVMGAYNRVNGEPCCGSETLLKGILMGDWGFQGHIVSDCGALEDFHTNHGVTATPAESAALAVKNGLSLNCGEMYEWLLDAVEQELVTEQEIDACLLPLMKAKIKLGIIGGSPYDDIPYSVVDCEAHRELNLETARKSLVLLKNDGILPLDKNELKSIAVIGPNADSEEVLLGNYHGTPGQSVTVLEGIRTYVGKEIKINYASGAHLYKNRGSMAKAVRAAEKSDLTVLCVGLDATLEGEQGDANNPYGGADKLDLRLPESQRRLIVEIVKLGRPLVVVQMSGSAITIDGADDAANAIVQAFYPGAQGGRAVAELLFGEFSPSGRLPVTFYRDVSQLPDFEDYSMANRTYKYFTGEPLYPFGYGLSYSEFAYSDLRYENETVSVLVKNIGDMQAREVTQLYVTSPEPGAPHWRLKGFKAVGLQPGEETTLRFMLGEAQLMVPDEEGLKYLPKGDFTVYVGGTQPDERSAALTGKQNGMTLCFDTK